MRCAPLWTKSKARVQCVASYTGNYHWIFLPGGPGLGSESLLPLTKFLRLPGNMWHVDFPGDGSNILDASYLNISLWKKALTEVIAAFNNVILIAHSSSGMFVLTIPELEKELKGLVLIGTSPNSFWQTAFLEHMKSHPLPQVEKLQKLYLENPSNELLKKMTIASAPIFLTSDGIEKKREFLETLPYNCESHLWFDQHFHVDYQAKWVPKNIPTLIFTGDEDFITPIKLFKEAKDFQRSNILIESVSNASHFPWMENPESVAKLFNDYCQRQNNLAEM